MPSQSVVVNTGHWKTMSLPDCIERVKIPSKILKKQYLDEGTYPIISQEATQISGYWNNSEDVFSVDKPLVVFGDHTCNLKFVDFDFVVGADGVKVLKPKDFLDGKFFFYQLLSFNLQSTGYARHFRKLKEYTIAIPPLDEQERIVSILDEAFEQISNSLNHSEFILNSATSILSRGIDQEFFNKDKWNEQQFGDVCNFVRGPFGGSLKKSYFVDEGYAVYEQSHAIYDQFETVRYFIDDAKFSEMQRFELKSGDLIMSCSGTIGKIAIVPDRIKPGIINQALLKLTPNESILPEFLKYWMKSMDFQAAIKLHSGGAAIQNVASVKILKQITIHLPSLETQKEIIEKLNLLAHASQDLEDLFREKKEATTELKQSILQEAFNGTLRIAEGLADQS